MSNHEIVAAQLEEILDMYPRGARAVELLIAGAKLAERYMTKPGVTPQELREYIDAVNFILPPLERTERATVSSSAAHPIDR